MIMTKKALWAIVFVLFSFFSPVNGHALVIDFEGLADSTAVTNQYIGLTFSNAMILTAGVGLNESEFPPHSGTNIVFDNTGPIKIDFTVPVSDAGGYFTYTTPIILTAFDKGPNMLSSATSIFSNNQALSGDPNSSPNEFLQVASAGGIWSIEIAGLPSGGSFTLDDLTYTPLSTAVPEPITILFLSLSSGLLAVVRTGLMKKKS